MPAVPTEQSAEYRRLGMRRERRSMRHRATPHRHGDRGPDDDESDDGDGDDDGDNDGQRRTLPIFVRYSDLIRANIVGSWTQLKRLMDKEGFPLGQMLSANIRAWRLDEIEAWLDGRPTERKETPDPWPESRRKAAEEKRAARQRADVNAPATVSQ
jgi:predicted DNA-binding transcriptional regulator AlpA